MKWFCWRLPKKSSISLSLLQEREGTVENRSKAIVLPFLFSDENRMMQSQRDNESIMEWNVLSSCTWFRDLHGSLSNLPLVRLHRYFFCWPQKVPCNRPHVMPPGYDNIDLKACEAKSVVAMNTPGQNANAVAELVFGMILGSICSILISIVQSQPGKLTWKMRIMVAKPCFPSKSSANSALHPAGWLSVLATTSMAPVVSSWSTARSLSTVSAQWRGRCISWLWALAWRVLPMIPTSRQRRSRCTTSLVDIRWLVFHFGKGLCCKVEPLADSLLGLLSKSWKTEIGLQWYVTSSCNLTQKKI